MSRPTAQVHANTNGTVSIQYVPTQSGAHDVAITYCDNPVPGTPLTVNVDSQNGHYVSAYGPGLVQGGSGETLGFFVTGAAKDVDVAISGPGKADVVSKKDENGVVHVTYLPLSPGEYDIAIKYKGRAIHGSPFNAKISGEGRKRSQVSNPATSEYALGGKDVDMTNMVGVLKTPSGGVEPCLLKKNAQGKLGIASFQPKVKGTYTVEVKQDGKAVAGSPFRINIDDHHVCNPHKVKISGAFKEATANTWNEVTLNIEEAGYGSLGISVEGGHRSDVELKTNSLTEYVLQYKPHEPGVYLLNIKFGDDYINGSPFMVSVGGEPSGRIRETQTIQVQNAELVTPGMPCSVQLKIPGTDPLDMEAMITSPSGKTELCEIRDMDEWLCQLSFTPNEEGVHTISLKNKGIHFAGSPYQYTVGKVPSGGTHKVEFGGPGVEKGEVESKNEFNIYYREAGAGTISVSVEGPSKANLTLVDRHAGYVTCCYVVSKEGDYGIHVKYNDEHVPDSPATVRIVPVSADAKKITVIGLRDRGLEINKPATFSLDMGGARGTVKAHVNTPSGADEDVFVTEIDDEKQALRFMPKENGVYYVHIKFNEAHIPGSPLAMLVGKLHADPALVHANGDGLEKAESGKAAKFTVITTNAGAGTLAVSIDGPSKTALVCTEVNDGYEFSYTPMAPGVYMIMIKYSNITIAGAPFKATVTGAGKPSDIVVTSSLFVETIEKKQGEVKVKRFHGDASRVVAQGNGLKKGFHGRAATFTLDVKDAGQAMLTLGMMSPKGNLVNDISVKKTRGTTYTVSFTAQETGDHSLVIRWGTDDIPGSPFTIPVA
jgi:filamin